jgi:hypothetical protein
MRAQTGSTAADGLVSDNAGDFSPSAPLSPLPRLFSDTQRGIWVEMRKSPLKPVCGPPNEKTGGNKKKQKEKTVHAAVNYG